mgnify:FL=1
MGSLKRAVFEGDVETGSVMAGQVAGMIHEIRPLEHIFASLYNGYEAALRSLVSEAHL